MRKKRVVLIVLLIVVLLVVAMLPFILKWLYKTLPRSEFLSFSGKYTLADILSYYASAFGMISSALLAVIAIYQTKRGQEKTDEVNRLTMELARKNYDIAVKQYEGQNEKASPKFHISISGCGGNYSTIYMIVTNTSDVYVINITSVSFEIKNENGEVVGRAKNVKFHSKVLDSKSKINVEIICSPLPYKTNLEAEWKFTCEDSDFNLYHFSAKHVIPNTRGVNSDPWIVERVG